MVFNLREQVDSKVLKDFGGVYDAQFLTEIKKERPYFAVLAEKASETVDSILSSASTTKSASPSEPGVAKPRVSKLCTASVVVSIHLLSQANGRVVGLVVVGSKSKSRLNCRAQKKSRAVSAFRKFFLLRAVTVGMVNDKRVVAFTRL